MSNIINRTLLAQYSPLPKNYDFSEIEIYIPIAQEIWVRPLLGSALMDELEYQVLHNDLSENNQALMTEGLLLQYLSYAVCLEGLPFIYARFNEKGITKAAKNEFSESLELKDLTYISQHLRGQVEFLKDSVKHYICEHSDYFPLADLCSCGCDGCSHKPSLSAPNPNWQLFTPRRKNTNLK